MCGIFCLLYHTRDLDLAEVFEKVICRESDQIKRRGPNCECNSTQQLSAEVSAVVHGCTLHLRGPQPVRQPLIATDGSFLLWNGEIFGGIEVPPDENDMVILFNLLQTGETDEFVINQLSSIYGPWAFIYWQATAKKLWFGRDIYGRRSLLWTKKPTGDYKKVFGLSSVIARPAITKIQEPTDSQGWEEVPALGIYCLDISAGDQQMSFHHNVHLYRWKHNLVLPQKISSILVEGGILPNNHANGTQEHLSPSNSIILNDAAPTTSNLSNFSKIQQELILILAKEHASFVFLSCLKDKQFQEFLYELENKLHNSIRTRVGNQTKLCQDCMAVEELSRNVTKLCSHTQVAVLFSGGLDSTILCAMADRFVPDGVPIDLLNVSFEQSSKDPSHIFEVPDRITGREALKDLQLISKSRTWNFVEINVTKAELVKYGESQIYDLVYPATTVLDSDLGCAVWFAARGKGRLLLNENYVEYKSPARVVLTGIGADEQFGGYSRHRVCYLRDGWQGLIKELEMEMGRIYERNLGRDDRMIADHGREGRFPFLDEELVNYVSSIPISYKVNLDFQRGVGDKLLLRILAFQLGLVNTASFAKRAMQFGSRISKMESGRHGNDTCLSLKAKLLTDF